MGKTDQIGNQEEELTETVVEIRRVSKKTKGGNQMRFTALVVVGDRRGRVGTSLRKAPDVVSAIRKAMRHARKQMVRFPIVGEARTIPHEIVLRSGAAQVYIKPAPAGTGIRAGGAVRAVLEAGGLENVVGKIIGTGHKKANVDATIKALQKLRTSQERLISKKRA